MSLCVLEKEFVRVVEHVAKILYRQLGTLHGTKEDFQQQVALWALEAMPKYDGLRPLDGFIFRHARNRALNYVRDHYHRSDPSCAKCNAGSPCGEDGGYCRRHTNWLQRNRAKANLARPADLEHVGERTEAATAETDVAGRELEKLIDGQLPIELRSCYLRMLAGEKVESAHRRKVQEAVADIIGIRVSAMVEPTSSTAEEPQSGEDEPSPQA